MWRWHDRAVPENYFNSKVATDLRRPVAHLFEPEMVDRPSTSWLTWRRGAPSSSSGIGTGRLGLPLGRRGLAVYGIELSADMIDQLRREPGGDRVEVTLGDFASAHVEGGQGAFSLAYLVRNTIMNLTTQDDQVACFANVRGHLCSGRGVSSSEVMVPELRRLPPGETVRMFAADPAHLGFEEYDVVTQRSVSPPHVGTGRAERRRSRLPFRYVWPSELDLMARLAGLTRRSRWADWERSPFTNESESHVSVWRRGQGHRGLSDPVASRTRRLRHL